MNNINKISTLEERHRMIETAAYYRAKKRGFSDGDPVKDWLEAEGEIEGEVEAEDDPLALEAEPPIGAGTPGSAPGTGSSCCTSCQCPCSSDQTRVGSGWSDRFMIAPTASAVPTSTRKARIRRPGLRRELCAPSQHRLYFSPLPQGHGSLRACAIR